MPPLVLGRRVSRQTELPEGFEHPINIYGPEIQLGCLRTESWEDGSSEVALAGGGTAQRHDTRGQTTQTHTKRKKITRKRYCNEATYVKQLTKTTDKPLHVSVQQKILIIWLKKV